eukprot:SAG11_NODE_10428_length_832_cov_1.609823_1_plen_81_part_00
MKSTIEFVFSLHFYIRLTGTLRDRLLPSFSEEKEEEERKRDEKTEPSVFVYFLSLDQKHSKCACDVTQERSQGFFVFSPT